MPDPGTILQVGAQVAGTVKGVIDLFGAKKEEKKARAELSRLKQPFYKIQNEYYDNRNIAGELAGGGLPDSSKNYYTTEAQRGLGTGINAVTTAGGSPNDVNRLFDTYNNSINKVASEDAQMRVQNIQNFMNVNRELAGQKTTQWSLNEYAPYQRKLKEGLIEKQPWEEHGAYSYLSSGRVPKKKRYLLEFVHKEREKWLRELGGEENLSSIELSMLDEACRLLLFSSMVNDYLLCDKESNILYTDDTGNIQMHTAVSRHYLSFTRTYIQILKELQKIVSIKPSAKKGGMKKDSASRLQDLYKKGEV